MQRLIPFFAVTSLLLGCPGPDAVGGDSNGGDSGSGSADGSGGDGAPTTGPSGDTGHGSGDASGDGPSTGTVGGTAADTAGDAADGTAGGTAGDGTGGTAGTGGSAAGYCAMSCEQAADCCPLGSVGCPSMTYPDNWDCTDGVCEFGGCTTDDDCNVLPTGTDSCHPVDGVGTCYNPCAEDNDCMGGATCTGVADDGTNFCETPAAPCQDDSDCAGFGICNVDTGECYCDSDSNCTADGGDVCVMP